MNVTPRTEKEIAELNLIPPGVYDFEILDGMDKVSKAGSEMIELKLKVWDGNGAERIIFDYLLDAMAFKLRHAAELCGLIDQYNAGRLNGHSFKGKTGKLKLGIQKDKNGVYADKNVVADYVTQKVVEAMASHKEAIDDAIPF